MLGDEWSGGWMSFDDHVTFQPRTTKLFLLALVKQRASLCSHRTMTLLKRPQAPSRGAQSPAERL